jgi:hypothetical protein
MAAERFALAVGAPTLPKDLFYNPWRPVLLARDMLLGLSAHYGAPTPAVALERIREANADPALVVLLAGTLDDASAWVSREFNWPQLRKLSQQGADTLGDEFGGAADRLFDAFETVGQSALTVVKDRAPVAKAIKAHSALWKTASQTRKLLANRERVVEPPISRVRTIRTSKKEDSRATFNDARVATLRALLSSRVADQCDVVEVVFDGLKGAFNSTIEYYDTTFPLILCDVLAGWDSETTTTYCVNNAKEVKNYVVPENIRDATLYGVLSDKFSSIRGQLRTKSRDSVKDNTNALASATGRPALRPDNVKGNLDRFILQTAESLSSFSYTELVNEFAAGSSDSVQQEQRIQGFYDDYVLCSVDKLWHGDQYMTMHPLHAFVFVFLCVLAIVGLLQYMSVPFSFLYAPLLSILAVPVVIYLPYSAEYACGISYPNPFSALGGPDGFVLLPLRLFDDIYTAVDLTIFPENPTWFDDITKKDGKTIHDCAADPYGMSDGARVVAFYLERVRPSWREDLEKIPLLGSLVQTLLRDFFGGAFSYFKDMEHTSVHDACARFMTPTGIVVFVSSMLFVGSIAVPVLFSAPIVIISVIRAGNSFTKGFCLALKADKTAMLGVAHARAKKDL